MSRRQFLGVGVAVAETLGQFPEGKQLQIVVPPDGGTPRTPGRIVRLGEREFRILAEDGEGDSPLTHAVSRMDVVVQNPGEATELVLHLDLSGDGKRTNFDEKPEGGMPRRDYLYIQRPGQSWQRVDGTTEWWVATVRFMVPTGETKVGISPWYTYGDYLAYVGSLPAHPHLTKSLFGKSDAGREHWEIAITDPSIPAEKKKRILWHAREHAYETFSSFAMEGLVAFLLSAEAAEYRKQFVFHLHPMINVDGVANGYEYRGGYDFPSARGTASGRLAFESVDRMRPDFVIAWHNWIAPRDVDVVFFTDSVDGKISRRAWDLFTQRFPSPQAVGHRWSSERNPNEKNWFGRALSDHNVHMYAMKQYGTRVWGWEMPWWNRDEGDPIAHARHLGVHFGRAFLDMLRALESPPAPAATPPPVIVPCRETHEFALRGRCYVENPFKDAALIGDFIAPSGKRVMVEGFHCGEDLWKLRFVPDEEGEWRYLLRGEGVALFVEGTLQAIAPRVAGFIGIHPDNPYAFAYADKTPFFPMGDTCYGLHDDSPITPELRREYLETRRKQNFNFVRMSIGHSTKRAIADSSTYWAWGGTPEKPDLDRINPRFFDSLEAVLREMEARGMNAELLLLNFYRTPFTDTSLWTPSRERLWLRYVIARFASFKNIFLWTLANEYETHPDGKYRLDAGDVEWAKRTAQMVKSLDPYGHPITVHPVISSNAKGASPRDDFEPPWRIGGFFGKSDALTVLSQQTSTTTNLMWDEKLQCWTGDGAGVEKSIAVDRVFSKPVLNMESGYEYLVGYPTMRQQVYQTDRVRRACWRIVCAGGYFAAGFASTLGHSDIWEQIDAPNRYPFLMKDSGVAAQFAALYAFFQKLPFWKLEPRPDLVEGDALCLAVKEEVYVVYLPHGGTILRKPELLGPGLSGRWFNPRTGQFDGAAVAAEGTGFRAPDGEDWALMVGGR